MAKITNIPDFTNYWKEKYPSIYGKKTDEDIINLVRERYPDLKIPSYEEALQTHQEKPQEVKQIIEEDTDNSESLMNQKRDPSWVDSWFLTGDFIPDKWQNEGALGGMVSADFFRQAYNNSMAGQLYKTVKGKDKWQENPGYDPAWYAQAGQFAVGMLSPLDAATMIGTSALGKMAAGTVTAGFFGRGAGAKYLEKGIFSNMASKYPKMGTAAMNTIEGALSLGIGGGSFAASHALVHETARQRVENPEGSINIKDALKVASDEFLHSAPMFAIAGGVTQGIMGSLYGYSQAFMKKGSYSAKMTQAATSPLSRVGTEAALFTSLPSMMGDENAPKLGSKEWWAGLGTNALIVGGMRAVGNFTQDKYFDATKFLTNEIKLSANKNKTLREAVKAVDNNLGTEAPKVTRELVRKLGLEEKNITSDVKQVKKELDFIKDVNQDLLSPDFVAKTKVPGSAESIRFGEYAELVNKYSTVKNGAIDNLIGDKGKLTERFKEYYGENPTPTELKKFEMNLKNWKEMTEVNRNWVDDYLGGNWFSSQNGINGGNPGTPSQAVAWRPRAGKYQLREDALKSESKGGMSNKEIIKEAKKHEIDVNYNKATDTILNREQIINSIFDAIRYKEETLLGRRAASAPQGGGLGTTGRMNISEVISSVKNENLLQIDIAEYNRITSKKAKDRLPAEKEYISNTDIISKINASNLNDINKSILAYSNAKSATRPSSIGTERTIKLFEFAEKKYNKKSIDLLTDVQKQNLIKDFMNDFFGVDVITSSYKRVKDNALRRALNNDLNKVGLIKNEYNKVLNSLKEHLHHGEVQNTIGYNLMFPSNKGIPTGQKGKQIDLHPLLGQKEITIAGGLEGVNKLSIATKNSNKQFKVGNNIISAEEASLILDVANKGFLRPMEVPLIKVSEIDIANGLIKVAGKKGMRNVSIGKELAQKLKDFADKNNLKPNDNLFKLNGQTKNLNTLMTKIFQEAPSNLKPEIFDTFTGESYAFNKNIKTSTYTLPSGEILGGKAVTSGIQASSLLRRIFELREKGMTEAQISSLLGQTSSVSQKSYGKAGAPKPLTPKKKATQHLPEELIFQTKGDKAVRDRFIANVMKKNKLTKEQLKRVGLDEGVLGEFGEGVIKLQKGVWQPSDFYHENLHRLKAFAKSTNNKSLEKLIARGEKLAINTKEYKAWKKKNANRDVEEFLADIVGGKASRMEFSKGLLNKVNQFIKQLVSRVKVAFGAGNFNDISRVLSKRVQKGFSTEGVAFAKGQVKYKMQGMTPQASLRYAKKTVQELFKDNELQGREINKIVKYIGEIANLGDDFKLTKETPMPALEQFVSTINSMDKAYLKRLPNKLNWWDSFRKAEKLRLIKNVNEKQRELLLKDLEVLDGNIYKATNQQLKDFIEIVNTMDDVQKSTTTWIDQQVTSGKLNPDVADRFKAMTGRRVVMPVQAVLESVGLKKLADKLYKHTSRELDYIGDFTTFETNMGELFGARKWNKVKDMTYLFDKKRYYDRLDNGWLTNAEKSFINKAFDISDKNNWVIKSGKEGTLVKEHMKLMKNYKDALVGKDGALRQVLNNAEFEKFVNDKNINWLNPENNIYVQRRLTQEFKKYYRPNERHFEQLIQEQTESIANNLAKRWFKERNQKASKEQIKEKSKDFIEDANAMAHGELYELFNFNPGKYSPSFLKKRHVKLPEFVTLDGKKVQVYETNFGLTTKDYAINQAKFLANVEYFPEFVKLKGFNKPGAKELLAQLKVKDSALAEWVDKRVLDHLKIDRRYTDYPDGIRITRHATALLAKFQLSFPTSGLKNFLVGSSQSLLAFRLRDFFGGFADAIHKDNRAMVKATGATEIGMRVFEMGGGWQKWDKVASAFFKAGGMKPSENLNRYISVLAGKRDQAHLVRRLQYSKKGSNAYNKAARKLEKFYKLNPDDIALLEKFGMKGIEGLDPKTAALNKRKLDTVYQQMNTFAHINTQGASINLFMPDWAGGPLAQSALLYKRMAYAATVNTARNMKIALDNKSLLRPVMFGLGTYVSGEILLQFYDKILGQTMPKENSDEFNILQTTLWKGEFLGILSEFLSPFGDEYLGTSLYPSVLSTAGVMFNSFKSVIEGKTFVGQGVNDLMKGTTGLYNNTRKVYKQGLLSKDSYASQSKRFKKLYFDMLKEYNDRDEMTEVNNTNMQFEQNKYMRSFKELFESGYAKDAGGNSIGKWYMMCLFAKANDYYYKGITESGYAIKTPEQAMKQAKKSMETVLTKLNPDKTQITAKTKKGAFNQIKKGKQFREWLDRNEPLSKELEKLNKQYWARRRQTEKQIKEYILSSKLDKDLEYYGISIGKLFK